MNPLHPLLATALLLAAAGAVAQDNDARKARAQELLDGLRYQTGTVAVERAHATLALSEGFRYLDAADAERVLHDLWRNPPDASVVGMLVPDGVALTGKKDVWVVVMHYSDDGYVSDKEASALDYDRILRDMQEHARDANPERRRQGYPEVELVGWATPPHYDSGTNKLYWAKELDFKGAPEHTLNYDIRVLGRGGYLSFNAIAGMHQLGMVQQHMPQVLGMAQFDAGQRYTDFNSTTDKVAAYGIGALVAGAIAAKAGLFAKLLALLLAFKKAILVGVVALVAALRKFFARSS